MPLRVENAQTSTNADVLANPASRLSLPRFQGAAEVCLICQAAHLIFDYITKSLLFPPLNLAILYLFLFQIRSKKMHCNDMHYCISCSQCINKCQQLLLTSPALSDGLLVFHLCRAAFAFVFWRIYSLCDSWIAYSKRQTVVETRHCNKDGRMLAK